MKILRSALVVLFAISKICAQTGTLIVLNKSDNTASLIDAATKKIVATLPTGVGPHEVAVSPEGRWAVVSNYGARDPGNSLTVIDIAAKRKAKDIQLGDYKRPHGSMWFKDGKRLAVTAEVNKALLIVDVEVGKVVDVIETGQEVSHMVVLTSDNSKAFVANIRSGTVAVIDLKEKKRVVVIPTGDGAEGIAISPDGKEVWVTNRAANTVSVISVDSLKVIVTLESKDFPIRTKFTPDGKYALVSNARSGDVAVFDAQEKKEIRRIKMELSTVNEIDKRLFGDQFGQSPVPIGILIPPDGTHAYIANSNADMLTAIDLESWKIVDRIKTGKEPDGLGYSQITISQ